jgi:6-phosphogluconate dehydrogenase (decarboxylating)
MELGMIGLGRMGINRALRLEKAGHEFGAREEKTAGGA